MGITPITGMRISTMTSNEYIQNYLDNKLYMHYLEEG